MKKYKKMTAAALAAVLAVSAPIAGAESNVLSVTASAEETEELWDYRLLDDGTISLTEYGGTKTNVVIPSTYDGKTVSQLNDRFFESENGRNKITSLTIPANMEIGGDGSTHNGDISWRFANMLALESISITGEDEHYSTVDGVLFNKDKTELIYYPNAKKDSIYTIPDTVEYIGREAFHTNNDDYFSFKKEELLKRTSYPSLKCIKLSKNTTVDGSAFGYCSALTEIKVSDDSPYYTVIDGVLFNKDMTTLLAYPSAKEGTSYNVPEGVRSIVSREAFSICPTLTSISLPKSTTYVGALMTSETQFVFEKCVALEEISVDEENTSYCSVDGVLFDKDKTILRRYPRAKKDLEYEIPDGVTRLDEGAFENCTSLTKVSIPNSVTGGKVNRAFQYCTGLTEIVYEGSQEEWDELVDPYSDNLDNVKVTFVEPTTSDPATSDQTTSTGIPGDTGTPGSSDKQETIDATLKNVDSKDGLSGAALEKQLFGDSGWTWEQVEKIEFTSDKLFSVRYTAADGSTKTLGEKAEDRAADDGIWNTAWTLDTSLMSKDKPFVKLIAKDGTADITAKVYIKKDAQKPADSDQKSTGIALAIAPAVLAAGAVIVISKKRK